MRKIYFNWQKFHPINYLYDVEIIIQVCKNKGYKISSDDAHLSWLAYSDDLCAGLIDLPNTDDAIWECIEPYLLIEKDTKK